MTFRAMGMGTTWFRQGGSSSCIDIGEEPIQLAIWLKQLIFQA